MVKISDFPGRRSTAQFPLEPVELRGVHVIAVEHNEANIALGERVIALPPHVKRLVEALDGIVMVPQARIELHPGSIEQRLVGLLEFNAEIPRGMPSIDVIAQHYNKIEWELGSRANHLLGHLILIGIA